MKYKAISTLVMVAFVYGFAHAQTISKNLDLADFISYQTLYNGQSITPANEETLNDVASWKDVRTGKEYALICLPIAGSGSGVAVVEVTDPSSVSYVKTIRRSVEHSENTPADVKVYNDVAFVAQNWQPTYWVDLTAAVDNPGNSTAGYGSDITSGLRIHNLFVNAEQQLLFLSYFISDQKIQVYDISGLPNSVPNLVGEIPQLLTGVGSRSHDLYALKLTSTTGRVFDATLVSVTVSDYTWNGSTFSVTSQLSHEFNPRRGELPSAFTNVITPEAERVVHGAWVGQDSDYLFTTVEGNSGSNSEATWVNPGAIQYQRGNHLAVWDILSIDAPADGNGYRYPIKQVYEVRENADNGVFAGAYFSELSNEKCNSIHNIVTRGTTSADTAFISYYTKGIRVLDVTDPANMSEIAYYDVPGVSQYLYPALNGVWGVDPFLPSGTVLGSSSDGLYVFRKPGVFAGSINVDTRWSGVITVTGSVPVSSGVTLTIDPGTVINFASGSKLTVNGDLQALGTSSQNITFTASGSSWNGIYFASMSSGVLKYCNLDKLTGSAGSGAITISGSSSPSIEYSTIDVLSGSYVFGVSASGGSSTSMNPKIYKSTVRSASGHTLYTSGSGGYLSVHDSEIIQTSSAAAVRASGGSSVGFWIAATIFDGLNKVKGGKLDATGNSIINAGESSGSKDKNHFCDAGSATLQVASGAVIYARYDYWPNGGAPTQINNGGTIYYDNNRGASDCAGVSMMASGRETNPMSTDGSDDWRALFFEAKGKARAGLIAQARSLFIQVIQSQKMPEAHAALLELARLYRGSQDPLIPAFITDFSKQPGQLKATAMKMAADIYAFQNKQAEALALLDDLVQLYPGTADAFYAQLEKFYLYFYADQYQKAEQTLEAMQPRDTEDAMVIQAARHLMNLEAGETISSKQALKSNTENFSQTSLADREQMDETAFRVDVYPNPFNPVTAIRFQIPDESHVILKIYDFLGREVNTLVNRIVEAGQHEIHFDGSRLPSGVYLYRLEAMGQVKSGKLVLQK